MMNKPLPKGFEAVGAGSVREAAGEVYPVIAVHSHTGTPLVDIPMMSDEKWMQQCQQAREEHPDIYALYDQLVAEGYQGDELIDLWMKRMRELQ